MTTPLITAMKTLLSQSTSAKQGLRSDASLNKIGAKSLTDLDPKFLEFQSYYQSLDSSQQQALNKRVRFSIG